MTRKLYDEDAYAIEFDAKVLDCRRIEKDGKELYEVELDQTLFFPEEGGQSSDVGVLDNIEVFDVQIRKDCIYHIMEAALDVGEIVHGKIDWDHRFDNMQQHTGEHIFSGLVHSHYGFDNVGFHLNNQIVTMDFNGVLTSEQIMEIEKEVNEVIVANIPVQVTFPSKEELEKLEYRSKIEIEGQVRIVTIPGYDVCACCAPHVRNTGEIGMLKVTNFQNYKGGVRITMLCGFRALEAFRQKEETVNALMGIFTTNQDAIVDNVNKLRASNQTMKNQIATLNQTIMEYKLKEIPEELEDVVLFEQALDQTAMRNTVNKLTERHSGLCAIFSGDDTNGYQFIVGSKNVDCKELAKSMKEQLASRGGGSSQMIQGSVSASKQQLEQFFQDR